MGDGADSDEENDGYQVAEKRDLDELVNLDQDDDALQRWKASILEGADATADDGSGRQIVITEFSFLGEGRDPITYDLSTEEALEELKATEIIVTQGLKYKHKVKRMGKKLDAANLMLGSYAPGPDIRTFTTDPEVAPSGMLARASYNVESVITDDDGVDHLGPWTWKLRIKKDWS